ncbi:MAG: hypothetical protein IKY37_08465 [Bacteroidaceae bacterium]|nr:hypothetical protein [Bacteroidaceae bacterium]
MSSENIQTEKKKKKKKKRGGIINTIMGGSLFANEFVRRNAALIALIVFYSFIYVSNRYEYERELMKIEKLTKKRDKLKNNLLTLKSEFTSKSRQTELEKILKSRDSEIETTCKPMYSIKTGSTK